MPESVQNGGGRPTFFQTLKQEAKMAAVGAGVGLAGGLIGGAVVPPSKNNIAVQVADKFIHENSDIVEKSTIFEKIQQNEVVKELVEKIQKNPNDKKLLGSVKEAFECDGDAKEIIKYLESLVDDSVKGFDTETVAKELETLIKQESDRASDVVKKFFSLSKSQRQKSPDFNLVKTAKKCAKHAQIEKLAARGVFVGVFAMLLVNFLSAFNIKLPFGKKNNQNAANGAQTAAASEISTQETALNTTQG